MTDRQTERGDSVENRRQLGEEHWFYDLGARAVDEDNDAVELANLETNGDKFERRRRVVKER